MTDPLRCALLAAPLLAALPGPRAMAAASPVIDAFDRPPPQATSGARWRLIEDGVMGGRSDGAMTFGPIEGRPAVRLTGRVSLENNGGFLQIALDLGPDGEGVDARGWAGIEVDALGNGEEYNAHLRLSGIWMPWQAFRATFRAEPAWRTVRLPFAGFDAYRTDRALDLSRLRRIGFVAIGRAFDADLAVGGLRFYA